MPIGESRLSNLQHYNRNGMERKRRERGKRGLAHGNIKKSTLMGGKEFCSNFASHLVTVFLTDALRGENSDAPSYRNLQKKDIDRRDQKSLTGESSKYGK